MQEGQRRRCPHRYFRVRLTVSHADDGLPSICTWRAVIPPDKRSRNVSELGSDCAGLLERYADARSVSASRRSGGKLRPLVSARRRIPAHAFGLKENRDGTCVSKTSDKEHTTASLGYSEELSIKHSPCHAIPAFLNRIRELEERIVLSDERSGDVLPNDPSGKNLANSSEVFVHETRFPVQAAPVPCD